MEKYKLLWSAIYEIFIDWKPEETQETWQGCWRRWDKKKLKNHKVVKENQIFKLILLDFMLVYGAAVVSIEGLFNIYEGQFNEIKNLEFLTSKGFQWK